MRHSFFRCGTASRSRTGTQNMDAKDKYVMGVEFGTHISRIFSVLDRNRDRMSPEHFARFDALCKLLEQRIKAREVFKKFAEDASVVSESIEEKTG